MPLRSKWGKAFNISFQTKLPLTVVTAKNCSPCAFPPLPALHVFPRRQVEEIRSFTCQVEWCNGLFLCSLPTCCCLIDLDRFNFGALQVQHRQLHGGVRVCRGWMGLDQLSFGKQSPSCATAGTDRGVSFLAWDIAILEWERVQNTIFGVEFIMFLTSDFVHPRNVLDWSNLVSIQ